MAATGAAALPRMLPARPANIATERSGSSVNRLRSSGRYGGYDRPSGASGAIRQTKLRLEQPRNLRQLRIRVFPLRLVLRRQQGIRLLRRTPKEKEALSPSHSNPTFFILSILVVVIAMIIVGIQALNYAKQSQEPQVSHKPNLFEELFKTPTPSPTPPTPTPTPTTPSPTPPYDIPHAG